MKFIKTDLEPAHVIELDEFNDHRGMFARIHCENEFKEHGLASHMVQTNMSITNKKGTLRGMHYQVEGAEEDKLVRCVKGKVLDVIIDVRKGSPTFGKHFKVELSEDNRKAIYVPKGFAHGILALSDDAVLVYHVSQFYTPGKEKGIRWNDPFFNIEWPVEEPILSEKDANHPLWEDENSN